LLCACRRDDAAPAPGSARDPRDEARAAPPEPASAAPPPTAERTAPSSSAAAAAPPAPPPDPPEDVGEPTREARRWALRRLADEPRLAQHHAAIAARFGKPLPLPIDVQEVPLAGGGRVLLLERSTANEPTPMVLAFAPGGELLWSKERPLAGAWPDTRELALVAAAEQRIVLSWYDVRTRVVAARFWDADGAPFADFEILPIERCDALTAMHWPERGLLVIASARGGRARAQLLDEDGRRAWGGEGLALPWTSAAGAPVSTALLTDASVLVVQAGEAPDPKTRRGSRALAQLLGPGGAPLWTEPVDLGAVPATPPRARAPRLAIAPSPAAPGAVRVTLPHGSPRPTALVAASGPFAPAPR
jgi:hypothetical protein